MRTSLELARAQSSAHPDRTDYPVQADWRFDAFEFPRAKVFKHEQRSVCTGVDVMAHVTPAPIIGMAAMHPERQTASVRSIHCVISSRVIPLSSGETVTRKLKPRNYCDLFCLVPSYF